MELWRVDLDTRTVRVALRSTVVPCLVFLPLTTRQMLCKLDVYNRFQSWVVVRKLDKSIAIAHVDHGK